MGDEDDEHDAGHEPVDEAVLAAWRSLPSEHRALLWQLLLHDQELPHPTPAGAPTSRGVADPGERARDRLRLGLLSELVARAETSECAAARRTLGGHLRHLPSGPRTTEVDRHLAECTRCRTAVAVLVDVDGAVRSRVAPALLPGAFPAVMATDAAAAAVELAGPDDTDGADPGAGPQDGAGAGHVVGPGGPPARVLPVSARPFAWLTAAAALALAAVLLLPESVPSGTVTAEGPSPRPPSSRAESATTAASAPRPVIGVAVAEPLSPRREAGALAAGGARPGPPVGVRAAFSPRRQVSGAAGQASPRSRSAAATVPAPPSRPGTSPPTSMPVPSTPHEPPTPPDPTTAPPPSRQTDPAGSVLTTLVFVPADRGSYVATLSVSPGWLVSSVVDQRGHRAVEHVVSPSAVVADRMHAGRVVVEVTRVTGSARGGSLLVSFVNGSGSALAGSGTYALR